jgi:hypothetical protein
MPDPIISIPKYFFGPQYAFYNNCDTCRNYLIYPDWGLQEEEFPYFPFCGLIKRDYQPGYWVHGMNSWWEGEGCDVNIVLSWSLNRTPGDDSTFSIENQSKYSWDIIANNPFPPLPPPYEGTGFIVQSDTDPVSYPDYLINGAPALGRISFGPIFCGYQNRTIMGTLLPEDTVTLGPSPGCHVKALFNLSIITLRTVWL